MKIIKCRIILLDLNSCDYSQWPKEIELKSDDIGKDGVFVHEYKAPEGFIQHVGYGVLFMNSWSCDDTSTIIQTWDDTQNQWIDFVMDEGMGV